MTATGELPQMVGHPTEANRMFTTPPPARRQWHPVIFALAGAAVVLFITGDRPNNQTVDPVSVAPAGSPPLVLPDRVDLFTLVRIQTNRTAAFIDVEVLTIRADTIVFVDVVKCAEPGLWAFTGPAGKYAVRVTTFDQETGITRDVGQIVIGNDPAPGPNPPPNPPTPDIPSGTYEFGPDAYTWASYVPNARVKASAIADNFEAVAAGIAAGSYTTPKQANTELAGRNRNTLAGDIDNWRPWFAKWSDKANALNKSGDMTTAQHYATAFRETAVGLRSIK